MTFVDVTARKHDASTYGNNGCRCDVCRAAHAAYMREARALRSARRVLEDGRLVAPLPSNRHGRASTYVNWRCECLPCLKAHNVETCAAARKRRRRAREGTR